MRNSPGLPAHLVRITEDPFAAELIKDAEQAGLVVRDEGFLFSGESLDQSEQEIALGSLSIFADDMLNLKRFTSVHEAMDPGTGNLVRARIPVSPYHRSTGALLKCEDEVTIDGGRWVLKKTYTFQYDNDTAFSWTNQPGADLSGFPWWQTVRGIQSLQEHIERVFWQPEVRKSWAARALGALSLHPWRSQHRALRR
jgi:hypothetical protein